jgi:hypothetical protein
VVFSSTVLTKSLLTTADAGDGVPCPGRDGLCGRNQRRLIRLAERFETLAVERQIGGKAAALPSDSTAALKRG